jgi:outer membrane protein assembly factor BamB
MRIHARVAVGSPTARVAVLVAATVILLLVVAGAVVGATTLMPTPNQATVLPSPSPSPTPSPSPAPSPSSAPASADWTTYRGNAARTGVTTSAGPRNNPVQIWRVQEPDKVHVEPVVAGGVVYAGCDDGRFLAFDAATGKQLWQGQTGASIGISPTVDGGLVYFGSSNDSSSGTLIAVDPTAATTNGFPAAVRWTTHAASAGIHPALVDGVVYTGSGSQDYVEAIDAKTGTELSKFQLGAAVSRSLTVADGTLFVGSADAAVHAINTATGHENWRFQTDGGVTGTPVVSGGIVFEAVFGGNADALYALDEQTGKELWRFHSPTGQSVWVPAVSGNRVYAASSDGALYAIDAATGKQVWNFTTTATDISAVTVADGVIYTGKDQKLWAIDPGTGHALWNFPLDSVIDGGPSISNGVAYIGTDAGSLYAIGSGPAGASVQPTGSAAASSTP